MASNSWETIYPNSALKIFTLLKSIQEKEKEAEQGAELDS